MSAPEDIGLTEAAHWLVFGDWGRDAIYYEASEAWDHDDPEGETKFGARRANNFSAEFGGQIFARFADDPSGTAIDRDADESLVRHMMAVT